MDVVEEVKRVEDDMLFNLMNGGWVLESNSFGMDVYLSFVYLELEKDSLLY